VPANNGLLVEWYARSMDISTPARAHLLGSAAPELVKSPIGRPGGGKRKYEAAGICSPAGDRDVYEEWGLWTPGD